MVLHQGKPTTQIVVRREKMEIAMGLLLKASQDSACSVKMKLSKGPSPKYASLLGFRFHSSKNTFSFFDQSCGMGMGHSFSSLSLAPGAQRKLANWLIPTQENPCGIPRRRTRQRRDRQSIRLLGSTPTDWDRLLQNCRSRAGTQ